MTRLRGEFVTDLAGPDALVACAEAIEGLGWQVESVEGHRIVTRPDSGATGAVPTIEVSLSDFRQATEIRITGADSDAHPLQQDELALELNRLRDAIQASIERADAVSADGTSPAGGDQAAQASPLARVPLFADRPPAAQLVSAVIVPSLFGAVVGVVLGISAGLYWILQLLALIGAVLAGLEHPDGRQGAIRGIVGGTLYGTFLLIAHAVAGTHATVKLPSFPPILIVFTALFGMLASGLGGRLRRRTISDPR